MKKLYAERLLQVVRVLEELPEGKRFDLRFWNKCGSVACAVGWAASDPWFIRRGLKLAKEEALCDGVQYYEPFYNGCYDFMAVKEFFGLASGQASNLFVVTAYKYPTRRNVIRRIKAFVKANT